MQNTAQAVKAQNKPSSREISAAGLRAFFNIARDWGLNTDEQIVLLGTPSRSTFFKWKSAPESADLKRDTLERLSYLLGIYKALQVLLPSTTSADA
ncbi:MAG: antitoxin Xre-like helix-turn-helix domain-containing protein, partial [Thiobacillus sp.]